MKHPVLTRTFSVVLLVMAIVMALSGVSGIRKAEKDYRENMRKYNLLADRIETYSELSEKLEGSDSYADVSAELEGKQSAHDDANDDHKDDTGLYSATKAGVAAAQQQIDQADDKLAAAQKEIQKLLDQMPDLKAQAEAQALASDEVAAAVDDAVNQALAEALPQAEAGARQGYAQAQQAYEGYQQATGMLASYGMDCYSARAMMNSYNSAVATMQSTDPESEEYMQAEAVYNSLSSYAPFFPYLEQAVSAIEAIEPQIGEITAMVNMGEEAFVQSVIDETTETVTATVRDTVYETVRASARSAVEEEMWKGVAEIEKAAGKLDSAKWQIYFQEIELKEDREKLESEKEVLEEETEVLAAETAGAKQLKEDEKRLNSTRILLRGNENIKKANDEGTDLLKAANAEYARQTESIPNDLKCRKIMCGFAIAAAVMGIAGVPAAFEQIKSRFMLVAPPVLYTVFAAVASVFSNYYGKNKMYACIVAAILGAVALFFIIPKSKKPVV